MGHPRIRIMYHHPDDEVKHLLQRSKTSCMLVFLFEGAKAGQKGIVSTAGTRISCMFVCQCLTEITEEEKKKVEDIQNHEFSS